MAASWNNGNNDGGKVDTYQIITDRLMDLLAAGTVPWHKPWAGKQAAEGPRSLSSNKPYRGVNSMMLGCQGYASPYWLTYREASALGGHVKRGEHGSPCVYWNWHDVTREDPDTGETVTRSIPFLKYYTVFNVEQTEGCKLPKHATATVVSSPAEPQDIDAAAGIVDNMPNRPDLRHGGNRAYYHPAADYVQLPPRCSFDGQAEYYSTAFHELAHSTGHQSRVGRTFGHSFGDKGYAREELCAEIAAAFLCDAAGIAHKTLDNSASYIASWLRELQNDKKLIVVAAGAAQKASDFIRGRSQAASEPEAATVDVAA